MELQDLLLKGLFLPFKLGSNTPSDQNKVLGMWSVAHIMTTAQLNLYWRKMAKKNGHF